MGQTPIARVVFPQGLDTLPELVARAYVDGRIEEVDELELRLDYALEGDRVGALGGLPKPPPPRDPTKRSTR